MVYSWYSALPLLILPNSLSLIMDRIPGPSFQPEEEEREEKSKWYEWRFLLREFGELVKRVILLNAAAAATGEDAVPPPPEPT